MKNMKNMKNMKKFLPISLACTMALSLAACSSDDDAVATTTYTAPVTTTTTPVTTTAPVVDVVSSATPDFVTLSTPLPSGELTEVTVPHFPDKIVFLDYMAFDMCATWGVIDALDYLTIQADMPEELTTFLVEGSVDLSPSLSKGDLSLIEEFAPDMIFTTQELGDLYEDLSAIAPTVSYEMDKSLGLYENFVEITKRNSTIFSVDYLIDPAVAEFDSRLQTLELYSEGVTAVVLKQDGNTVTPLVDNEEYSLIFKDLGFVNLAEDYEEDVQGDFTFEVLSELNPDYVFMMDLTFPDESTVILEETEGDSEETEGDSEETEGASEETEDDSEETEGASEETEGASEEIEGTSEETEGDSVEAEGDSEETEGASEEIEGASEETEGASGTAVALSNKILQELDTWESGKVVTLSGEYWHTVEGGVFAMDVMLFDLETAFGLKAENRLVCYRDTQAYIDYWTEKAEKQAAEAAALAAELGEEVVEETEEETESAGVAESEKEETETSGDSEKEETETSGDSEKEEAVTSGDSEKEETVTSGDSEKEETGSNSSASTTSSETDYESLEGKISDLEGKIADLESRISKLMEN